MKTEVRADPLTYRQVLTTRNVPQLLLAASMSRLASGMWLFVVVLYVLAQFDSPALAGLSGFFLTLPGFLVSPVAGAVLDRLGAVRAVALDTVTSAALVATIAVASAVGILAPPLLLLLLALYSLSSPLSSGGIRTLFPRFVPERAFDKVNALDLSTFSVIDVAAPLLAGTLFAMIGPDPTLFTLAAMYALAALSLLLLRGGAAQPEQPVRQHLLRSAWEGIRYLLRNPTLRGLAASYSLYQAASGILIVAVPVAVAQRFSGDSAERWTGVLWAIAGLTGAVGALIAGNVLRPGVERRYLVAATGIAAIAIYPLSALGSILTLGLGLATVGLMEGVANVSLLSLRQRRTDPRRLGRIMTVSISVNLIGFPIGTALGGVLATGSLSLTFAVSAAFTIAAALTGRLLVPR